MSGFDFTSFKRHAGAALTAFGGIEEALAKSDLPALLRHLVKLRASQINGCSFCVTMHSREAREDGETQERLDQLVNGGRRTATAAPSAPPSPGRRR